MTLPNWSLLGALLVALIGFVVYAAWSIDTTKNADQLDLGRYGLPNLEEAQAEQQRGTPASTANSSSTTEARDQTSSSESVSSTSTNSEPAELQVALTEIPPSGDEITSIPVQTLADPPAGISTPIDGCASEVSCADPPPQIPNQSNPASQPAPSCAANHGKGPCTDKKGKKGKNKP